MTDAAAGPPLASPVDEAPSAGPPTQRKRPVSVTLVAVLALAVAAYMLVRAVLALGSGDEARLPDGIFHLVAGIGTLAAVLGAVRMRPWGWTAFMTWAVIGLTHQVLRYLFFEDPNFADMAVNTFVVLALSPLDVQIGFGLRHTQNVHLAGPTRNPVDDV